MPDTRQREVPVTVRSGDQQRPPSACWFPPTVRSHRAFSFKASRLKSRSTTAPFRRHKPACTSRILTKNRNPNHQPPRRSIGNSCAGDWISTGAVSTQSLMRGPTDPVRTIGETMEADPQTRRQMGVWAATAVVTGEAISLGIFLTPAGMARSLGSPALLAAVWCGMAVITLAGALCFTELAVRNPHDGGEYLYLRRGFGRARRLPLRLDGRGRDVSRSGRCAQRRHGALYPGSRSGSRCARRPSPALILLSSRRAQLLRHAFEQRRDDGAELAQGPRARRSRWMGASFRGTPQLPILRRSLRAAPAPIH